MIPPLLAYKRPRGMSLDEFLDRLARRMPLIATPKIDGIRCQTSVYGISHGEQSTALSRSLKQIPNRHICKLMSQLPPGLDGEIVAGNFQDTQSRVMRAKGTPDFRYHVFDCMIDRWASHGRVPGAAIYPGTESLVSYPEDPDYALEEFRPLVYQRRLEYLAKMELPDFCVKVLGQVVRTLPELLAYEDEQLKAGWEGVMVRRPNSLLKMGRSTLTECILVALKRVEDAEGVVLGFEEMVHNGNEAVIGRTGHMERSSHQANLFGLMTLGALVVKADVLDKTVTFRVGSGFDDATRKEIWDHQDVYLYKVVKFRYQLVGTKEKPRTPTFLGFRDLEDMDHGRIIS